MNGHVTVRAGGLTFDLAGFSEKGPREENQDVLTMSDFPRTGIVAIADGMGGERGGRVAAETALAALLDAGPVRSLSEAEEALRRADLAVTDRAAADQDRYGGMGCALAFLSFSCRAGDGPLWICGHVGDVRVISRSPDGTVRLETRDHSVSFARWEAGEITLEEVARGEGSNRLRRSIGRGGEPDVAWIPVRPGWRYAIVSDGVSRAVGLGMIGEILARRSATAAIESLRERVHARGADDNFTAVVIRVGGAPLGADGRPIERRRAPRHAHAVPLGARATLASALSAVALVASLGLAAWTRTARVEADSRLRQVQRQLELVRRAVEAASDSGTTRAPRFRIAPPVAEPPANPALGARHASSASTTENGESNSTLTGFTGLTGLEEQTLSPFDPVNPVNPVQQQLPLLSQSPLQLSATDAWAPDPGPHGNLSAPRSQDSTDGATR